VMVKIADAFVAYAAVLGTLVYFAFAEAAV
jgi:hypothetical protein